MTRGIPYRQAITMKAINGPRDIIHVSFDFTPEQKTPLLSQLYGYGLN